ncbi:MAG: hypothetical protein VKM34_05890 [Cyanobacteriota bacterium]|nr:hypothetical protein [Cyanobacteriota bacterium]
MSPSGSVFSPSDEGPGGLTALRQKMGAHQAVEVWPASGAPQRLDAADLLEAGAEFPGLQLQLAEIWEG